MTVPYYDPSLNLAVYQPDWLIGATGPTITWYATGAGPYDHIRLWRNTTNDWTTATDVSGSLSGSATSYHDTSAVYGVGYYYWPIGYNSGETYAGNNTGCSATQVEYLNQAAVWNADALAAEFNPSPDFPLPVNIGGFFRSQSSFSAASSSANADSSGGGVDQISLEIYLSGTSSAGSTPAIAATKEADTTTWAQLTWAAYGHVGPGVAFNGIPNGAFTGSGYTFMDPTPCQGSIASPTLVVTTIPDPFTDMFFNELWGSLATNVFNIQVTYIGFQTNPGGGVGGPPTTGRVVSRQFSPYITNAP